MKNINTTTAGSSIQNPQPTIQNHRGQLDLSFNGLAHGDRPGYRRRQMLRSRATWWFQQMRRAVDSAIEWRPATPPRPEQSTLDLRRPTEVAMR
jgi:hypothetical protein